MRSRFTRSSLLLGCAAEAWSLHSLTLHGDFLQAGEAGKFAGCGLAAGLAFWLAALCFEDADLTVRQRTWLFWIGAVVLRLAVAAVEPGDDLWRYRWEGMIQLHGFNPYGLSPDAPALAHLRDTDWLKISHRDFPAIYPPLAQAFFALMAFCGNSVSLYKAVFFLADLVCCGVLQRLLVRSGESEACAVWYAWNPLVIYAFSGAAHFDGLMILCLLLAVWALDLYSRAPPSQGRHNFGERNAWLWLSALLLGVSAAVKVVPLILLPVWGIAAGSWRKIPGMLLLSTAPLAISAVSYGFPSTPVFSALQRFGHDFRVNDPVWWAVDVATGSHLPRDNTIIEFVTPFACLLLTFFFRRDWQRGLLWVWGALLLLSPVVHAWYVVWVLPIAVWRGASARPWVVLSISMFGYFLLWEVNHESGRPWVEPVWLRLAIYLPPVAALAWTMYQQHPRRTGTTLVATTG